MAKHLTRAELSALLNRQSVSVEAPKTISDVESESGTVTVTSTAHGFQTGDILLHESIGGAVQANGLVQITVVDADSYTVNGLASASSYTTGGTAKRVLLGGGIGSLKPNEVASITDALSRVPHIRGNDGEGGANESTLKSIFGL